MSIAMLSRTRPGRAENTITRSDRKIASSIWWVMNSTVLPAAFQMRSSSSCMVSRVCASSGAEQREGVVLLEARQPDQGDEVPGALARLAARHADAFEAVEHVAEHRAP